jgi:nucleoid-associated protein YgaU
MKKLYAIPARPAGGCYMLYAIFLVFVLSGCVVRTYSITKDRVDQDLAVGNRGYLKGQAAPREMERKATRTTQVVEVELHSPIKFEKKPKIRPVETKPFETVEDRSQEGNRGYIVQSITPEIAKVQAVAFEKYTVQKNDTLQKISKKFYGTTKKWKKLFDANQDVLKSPNKVYPGQVINIPTEQLREPQENLK